MPKPPDADQAQAAPPIRAKRRKKPRGRWAVPILIAGLVHLGAFSLFRVPAESARPFPLERPSIEWLVSTATSADSILAEQLAYFDHAPLFLPTKWNFGASQALATIEHSPADIFLPYADKLHFESQQRPAGLVRLPPGKSATEALNQFSWPYLDAFGRVDEAVAALEPRLAIVEVRSARNGELMHLETIPVDRVDLGETWPDWRPFDLYVSITSEGAVAMPMLGGGLGTPVAGSAIPEVVTDFFRRFLRHESRLELFLPAGLYRVTVGP